MAFCKKGCCFLLSFVKLNAAFLVCAVVMLVRLSAPKRGVLVEDQKTGSLCCCCDSTSSQLGKEVFVQFFSIVKLTTVST